MSTANLTHEQIAAILDVPSANVERYWPDIADKFSKFGIASENCLIAALATVKVETGCFAPVKEKGDNDYFVSHYWENAKVRNWLGNDSPRDAVMYCGRGFVQITGRANYGLMSHICGIDLLEAPELAMQPEVAAIILAAYFQKHNIKRLADAEDWRAVRIAVNGGTNGLPEFIHAVRKLKAANDGANNG